MNTTTLTLAQLQTLQTAVDYYAGHCLEQERTLREDATTGSPAVNLKLRGEARAYEQEYRRLRKLSLSIYEARHEARKGRTVRLEVGPKGGAK